MDGLKKAFCDQKMSRNFSIREGIQEETTFERSSLGRIPPSWQSFMENRQNKKFLDGVL